MSFIIVRDEFSEEDEEEEPKESTTPGKSIKSAKSVASSIKSGAASTVTGDDGEDSVSSIMITYHKFYKVRIAMCFSKRFYLAFLSTHNFYHFTPHIVDTCFE